MRTDLIGYPCQGNCEATHGGHSGNVRLIASFRKKISGDVAKFGDVEGVRGQLWYYCDNAVAEDQCRGYVAFEVDRIKESAK